MVWSLKYSGNTSCHRLQQTLRTEHAGREGNDGPWEHNAAKIVDSDGRLLLPEGYRKRWGLSPGTEMIFHETPEGLLVRPLDGPLKKIYVEPTSACNLNCRTCVRHSWDEPTGFMDMRDFRRMIGDLRAVSSLETMAFWGIGEPLLHPDIVEMVSLAKALGVKTELVTNALLLDGRIAEGLTAAGLDRIVVSVDGVSSKSYECIRTGGNLGAVMENVGYLNRLRSRNGRNRPEIGIEFVATQGNLSEMPNLRDLAYAMEASFIIVTNVLPYTEAFKDQILYWWSACNSCFPVPERSREYPEVILPQMDDRPEQIDAVKGLLRNNGIVNPILKDFGVIDAHCPFVWEGSMSICWDGSVSPCIALMHSYTCFVLGREKKIRRYSLGHIGKENILSVWNGDEFRAFRERVMRFEFSPCVNCGGCEFAEGNEEDCFGNTFPVCGDCLWARGVILCP